MLCSIRIKKRREFCGKAFHVEFGFVVEFVIRDSVSAAKADFFESIREAYGEQGIPFTPEEIDVEYRYDVPSFFNFFDIINVSKFAEFAGINESKMRAYKCGVAYPGEKTTEKIFRAIKKLATELSVASL